jgi:hypothetical protein
MKPGDWYNAKMVEDTVDSLSETAGSLGYAFAVRPTSRDKDDLTMGITFRIAEAPRVYVERVDVNGNTLTQDKVIRREFRLAEGDAFNSFRSSARPTASSRWAISRKSSRSSRSPALARPRRARSQCRGKAHRRTPAFGRFLEPRKLHLPGLDPAEQLPRARPDGRPLGRLFALFARGLPSLTCSTRTSRWASISIGATTTASTTSIPTATRPTSRPPPASRSAPVCR